MDVTNKILCATSTQGKEAVFPTKIEPDLPVSVSGSFAEAWVSSGLLLEQGHWAEAVVLGDAECWHKYLDCRGFDWAASGPTTNKEGTQAHPLAENWIKDLLSRPCPSEQDSVFPTACPSHQEACTSLLSSSIRMQTEEARTVIPQHPELNPNHMKLIKMITWIRALCSSVKL